MGSSSRPCSLDTALVSRSASLRRGLHRASLAARWRAEKSHRRHPRKGVGGRCRFARSSSRPRRVAKCPAGAPVFSQDAISPIPIAWTRGKTPRLGQMLSSTSTGPLLVAILSATERLRIARCEMSRPSHVGCSPGVAASRTSRPSSGSNAAPGARRYFRSGRRSSHWSVWPFCARSSSSGPAHSEQTARGYAPGRARELHGALSRGARSCESAITPGT